MSATFASIFSKQISNWANEGYLIALDIDESDSELMELITKASTAFGIGVISLDSQNIAQSRVVATAKFRANLDFAVVNELCDKNRDFAGFIKSAVEFDPSNATRYLREFDEVLDDDKFEKYLKNKEIC